MATKIGSLFYEIYADSSKLNKGLKESKSGISKLSDGFKSLTGVSLTAAGALTALAAGLRFAVNEAIEAEVSETKLNTVLESTGYAAGMTKDALMDMATGLSKVTMYSEETIMDAESLLLTFTKVGKDVFPAATEAALNMSAAFGQDLQSSVIQLGKALNDPSGMAAMKRIGVSFSDAQIKMAKAMFETNDIAGYQQIILDELNKEVGGMAEAMGGTYAGQVQILKNNLGELGETVGKAIVPPLTDFVILLNDMADGHGTAASAAANYLNKLFEGTALESDYSAHMREMQEIQDKLNGNVNDGTTGLQNFGDALEDTGETAGEKAASIWHFANGAWNLVSGLNSIPSHIDSYVTVHYSFEGLDSRDAAEFAKPTLGEWKPAWQNNNKKSDWNTGTSPGGATGLSMRVPPGYPGDSFMIGATSGETVDIGRGADRESSAPLDYEKLANKIGDAVAVALIRKGVLG